MVMANSCGGESVSASNPVKLRRSRRLSSTRGLKLREPANDNRQSLARADANQKADPCGGPRGTEASNPNGRLLINWELNERISLSSGSSTGLLVRPDAKRGIEFSDNRRKVELEEPVGKINEDRSGRRESRMFTNKSTLDLMNVSGFPGATDKGQVHQVHEGADSWSVEIDVIERSVDVEDVIKSDSKYEIGMLLQSSVTRKAKQRRQEANGTLKSRKLGKVGESQVSDSSVPSKWSGKEMTGKKGSDSISKRLELIHELNQKILANYERFQQKSKRGHAKGTKENSRAESKEQPERSRVRCLNGGKEWKERQQEPEAREAKRTPGLEEQMYSEVKRKNRAKAAASAAERCQDPPGLRNPGANKLLLPAISKEDAVSRHGEKKASCAGDQPEANQRRKLPRNQAISSQQPARAARDNENFSMAPRAGFYRAYGDQQQVYHQTKIESPPETSGTKAPRGRSIFHVSRVGPSPDTIDHSPDNCLSNSKLYPEECIDAGRHSTPKKAPCEKETLICRVEIETRVEKPGEESVAEIWDSKGEAADQELENQVLESLDETIGRFDCERDEQDKEEESFSSDSIQKESPSLKEEDSSKSRGLQETFNSSWDSGVGVDVGTGSGWVRVHTGIESSLVYLTLDTTAKDVCRDMLLGDDLSLFIQYGGEAGRRLGCQEKPLEIQDQFLQTLGYQDASRRTRLGVDPELRHLIAFHVGPASPVPDLLGYSRCGYSLVLKGLVFPQWKRRALAVIGSRLFLYPACPESQPEWMELGGGGGAVCYAPSRLGKLVLRITGFPRVTHHCHQSQQGPQADGHHPETRHLYLGFHHPWDRDLWKGWIKQAIQLPSNPKKLVLNNGGLARIPDSAVAHPATEEIDLSQNQLGIINNNLTVLHKFPKLDAVHLANNELRKIPRELLELRELTYLDLSGNKIERVPPDINQLINLQVLILDRNEIEDLPAELAELRNLRDISLAGNCLSKLPLFLNMRALTLSWRETPLPWWPPIGKCRNYALFSGETHRCRGGQPSAHAGTIDFTDVLAKADAGKTCKDEKNNQNNLYRVNLRNNQLKGNIILGNYGNLTHLDVSENSIEKLDVSALQELRSIRCARNLLTELTVCGRNLVSLIAGNNNLKKLTIEPVPVNLEHLDVSYNELDALPEWTPDLPVLRALFASHNALTALPDRLLSQPSRLEVLHLPHNRLQALPPPRKPLNIVHLTLQDNALTALPPSFFPNTEKMKVLNLSNNRLSEFSYPGEAGKDRQNGHMLEKLYLTANCLTDTVLDALAKLTSLRVLHIGYNTLDTLPESCISSWRDLEELVLSGNRLQYLPDSIANLQHLRVLRVHSNRLLTCPSFSKTTSLKVLDLAHNQLDRVNLATLVPAQLQFLDISCNSRLHVDPRQFQVYRSQRPISLVDVSGQNRPSLPSHPHQQEIVSSEKSSEQPWRLGFSETAGSREKLYISQVRMPAFCNVEGLFGIFDGGSNQEAPAALQEMIPRLLLEERTVRETSKEYLKYTLLSAHRELKEKGQKYGVDATLVHIVRLQSQLQGYSKSAAKYSLKVASSGDAKAVLCRAAGPLTLAPRKKASVKNQLGNAAMFPLVVPDPSFEEVALEDDDEFVIIANRRLWEVMSIQEAVREARAEASPVLAAKRLQDLAQAYGAEDNLSIIVVRLTGPNQADLDQLMRELRHAVVKNRSQSDSACTCPCCVPPPAHKPPGPCCCHANDGYYLNGVLKSIVNRSTKSHNGSGRYFKNRRAAQDNESPPYSRDDRSSPSGQSDQASDSTFKSRQLSGRGWSTGTAATRVTNKTRQSVLMHENGSRKASPSLPVQEDTISERSGALSEEQFRCWEYMLEQNTQLLFDKELDTLTRTPLRRGQSRSTPQLAGNLPFLSKRFGSARSFNPSLPRAPMVRFGSGRRLLNGGPNAAYFGSLQRLMPYNLEYDFAVIQERSALDSLEQDASRMQQYWGVATTEL